MNIHVEEHATRQKLLKKHFILVRYYEKLYKQEQGWYVFYFLQTRAGLSFHVIIESCHNDLKIGVSVLDM